MFNLFLQFLQQLFLYPFTLLPLSLFVLVLYKTLSANSSNVRKNRPPSPPRLPIIGNLHLIGELPHQSFASLSQKYGKIMLLHFGRKPIFVASTPEAAREILKTQDLTFCNRPESRVTSRFFNGCKDVGFSPYGEQWRMMKGLCITQLLSNKKVQSYRKMREEEVALVVEELKRSNSSVINLSEIINTQTYDLICRATFGRKYGYNDEGGFNFKELMDETMILLGIFTVADYIPWLGLIDRVKGLDRRMERVAEELDESLDKVMQEHQNRLIAKKKISSESGQGKNIAENFVEYLLEDHMEDKNALTMDDVKAIILVRIF
ncbi:hypothetical protein SOVF_084450 [Spinacia oleracea]|nr:hypothetical protein SOVF_084450 [Spinacia oleracea]